MTEQERCARKESSPEWVRYRLMMQERPESFRQDPMLRIETDLTEICRFEQESGRTIGVLYSSPYSLLVVDLVRGKDGKAFAYERMLPAVERGAVVSVPICGGRFVLLEQYRHSMRALQWAFPRGFAEQGISSAENVEKELREEIGAKGIHTSPLGSIRPDSGISGTKADVFLCEVDEIAVTEGYEGIKRTCLLTGQELTEWIQKGRITDGFTLAALTLFQVRYGSLSLGRAQSVDGQRPEQ